MSSYNTKQLSVIPTKKTIYGITDANGVIDGTGGITIPGGCNVFEIWSAVEFPDDTTSFRFLDDDGEMKGVNLSWMNSEDLVLPYTEVMRLDYIKIPAGSTMKIRICE